jgi:AcrR family transcriptional regulator
MARRRLTRQDWIDGALRALARAGVAAVAVDVLAGELGATRGSFYWHFKDRDSLLAAALQTWEQLGTLDVIERVGQEADPARRMAALFAEAFADEPVVGLDAAIVAHAGHPVVAPVLARVTTRRIAFLTDVYTGLGLAPPVAQRRATVAYAAFLGWFELRRVMREAVDGTTDVPALAAGEPERATLDHLIALLGAVPAGAAGAGS